MSKAAVNIGLVGLGIGQTHLNNLANIPAANIAAIADLNLEKAGEYAAKHGANAYPDWRAMLAGEPNLDAVVLATPAKIRREPITAIAERGLALFCEKPPATNLAEALEISQIVTKSGILNTVGFMYRWTPLATQFRELVAGRHLLFARGVYAWPVFGRVKNGDFPQNLLHKSGCGGPLIEQAIHFLDVLRYITDDEPVAVQAFANLGTLYDQTGRDCEETTAYILRHQSGMVSNHIHNWSHEGCMLQTQVIGEKFELTWNMDPAKTRLTGTVDGVSIDERAAASGYAEEMVGFVEAVRTGDQSLLRSPYADACKSLAVCEAGNRAVETGQPVAI